jgi:hypothetical protein
LADGEILTLVGQLLELNPAGAASIEYPLGHSARVTSETKLDKSMLRDDRQIILSMTFSFSDSVRETVSFHRGVVDAETWKQNPNQNGFRSVVPHPYFDELDS